jgi:hypothetical protein
MSWQIAISFIYRPTDLRLGHLVVQRGCRLAGSIQGWIAPVAGIGGSSPRSSCLPQL